MSNREIDLSTMSFRRQAQFFKRRASTDEDEELYYQIISKIPHQSDRISDSMLGVLMIDGLASICNWMQKIKSFRLAMFVSQDLADSKNYMDEGCDLTVES